ncbi:MAG TPA: hypothetical protein VIH40_07965, partial [Xanthobacteraceae bacterium]
TQDAGFVRLNATNEPNFLLVDGYADNNPDGPDPDYDPDPDPNMLLYGQVPHFDDFMADPVPFAFCMDT